MFNKIQGNDVLYELITVYCSENSIEVCLSEDIEEDRILIIKPDLYYNSSRMHNPPPSIDCIIIIKCKDNLKYSMNLIELRDIKSPNGFDSKNIVEKFDTVINSFLQDIFSEIFLSVDYCEVNCYFVSNPYKINKDMTQEDYDKLIKTKSLKLDYFNSIKPFKFKDKITFIKSKLPNPIVGDC